MLLLFEYIDVFDIFPIGIGIFNLSGSVVSNFYNRML